MYFSTNSVIRYDIALMILQWHDITLMTWLRYNTTKMRSTEKDKGLLHVVLKEKKTSKYGLNIF